MSGHDDAPAIKLYGNKKEQETYENLAGSLCLAAHLTCVMVVIELQQQVHA